MPVEIDERAHGRQRFSVRLIQLIACIASLCAPAFCEDLPPIKISLGYSQLRDQTVQSNAHGWVATLSGDVNRWLGLKGEVGGNIATHNAFGTNFQFGASSFFGGASVTPFAWRHATPFTHFLFGAVRSTAAQSGFAAEDYDFAMQPGGGMDLWLRPGLGIRFGTDYRITPKQEFTGSRGFRFQIGIVAEID